MMQSDILHQQMPLRIFSWAVIGIENELRYGKGSKGNIRAIVTDPVCDVFKGKLDVSGLNEKNRTYYEQICKEDTTGIWLAYKQQVRRKKRNRALKKLKLSIKTILRL